MSYVNDFLNWTFLLRLLLLEFVYLCPSGILIFTVHRQFFFKCSNLFTNSIFILLNCCWLIPCYCIATIMSIQEVMKEAFKGTFKGTSQKPVINNHS